MAEDFSVFALFDAAALARADAWPEAQWTDAEYRAALWRVDALDEFSEQPDTDEGAEYARLMAKVDQHETRLYGPDGRG